MELESGTPMLFPVAIVLVLHAIVRAIVAIVVVPDAIVHGVDSVRYTLRNSCNS